LRLHLIRHANAEGFDASGKDFNRSLSEKGLIQCEKTKTILMNLSLGPQEIKAFSSSSFRTKETVDLLFDKQFNFSYHDDLYLCSVTNLMDFIWELKTQSDIILVGHNSGLSDLASYFTAKNVFMKTGALLSIEFPLGSSEELSKGLGEINYAYRCNIDSYPIT
jgi:phosphohistidine phosphatase|tara:strand:- start:8877 stop:9368 length:492 start_codon:yes stop_codon:yes gene_type:complete